VCVYVHKRVHSSRSSVLWRELTIYRMLLQRAAMAAAAYCTTMHTDFQFEKHQHDNTCTYDISFFAARSLNSFATVCCFAI
jgi:hypothetical protein